MLEIEKVVPNVRLVCGYVFQQLALLRVFRTKQTHQPRRIQNDVFRYDVVTKRKWLEQFVPARFQHLVHIEHAFHIIHRMCFDVVINRLGNVGR